MEQQIERFLNFFSRAIDFILYPNFTGWLLLLKIIFFIISLVMIILIVYWLWVTPWIKYKKLYALIEFLTFRPYGAKVIKGPWERIKKRLETDEEAEYKLAIIEADTLIQETLERMGYAGQTLSEKLKNLGPGTISNMEAVYEAYKIRNNIINDPDYRINLDEAKRILAAYEQALKDLEVI